MGRRKYPSDNYDGDFSYSSDLRFKLRKTPNYSLSWYRDCLFNNWNNRRQRLFKLEEEVPHEEVRIDSVLWHSRTNVYLWDYRFNQWRCPSDGHFSWNYPVVHHYHRRRNLALRRNFLQASKRDVTNELSLGTNRFDCRNTHFLFGNEDSQCQINQQTGRWLHKQYLPVFIFLNYLPTEIYLNPFFFISLGSKIFLPSTMFGSFIFDFILSKSTTLNSGHSVIITKQSVFFTELSIVSS